MALSRWIIVAGVMLLSGAAHATTAKCRALDANDGALLLEVANRSSTQCTKMLATSMEKRRCAKVPRGTKIEYMTHYDHRGVDGKLTTVSCGTAQTTRVPKCRALSMKNKSTLADVGHKSSSKCTLLLSSAVQKDRCTAARRGKTIQYMTQYDHRGVKDKVTTLTCKQRPSGNLSHQGRTGRRNHVRPRHR